jgi:hypothetical protein
MRDNQRLSASGSTHTLIRISVFRRLEKWNSLMGFLVAKWVEPLQMADPPQSTHSFFLPILFAPLSYFLINLEHHQVRSQRASDKKTKLHKG